MISEVSACEVRKRSWAKSCATLKFLGAFHLLSCFTFFFKLWNKLRLGDANQKPHLNIITIIMYQIIRMTIHQGLHHQPTNRNNDDSQIRKFTFDVAFQKILGKAYRMICHQASIHHFGFLLILQFLHRKVEKDLGLARLVEKHHLEKW